MQVSEMSLAQVEQSGDKWNEMVNRGDEEILLAWPWVGSYTCRGDSKRVSKTRLHGHSHFETGLLSLYPVCLLRCLRYVYSGLSLNRDCMTMAASKLVCYLSKVCLSGVCTMWDSLVCLPNDMVVVTP